MYINEIVCNFTCDIGPVTRATKKPGITYAPELIVALGVEIMFPTSTSSTWLDGPITSLWYQMSSEVCNQTLTEMLQSRRSQCPPPHILLLLTL